MKVYLAASYGRKDEINTYREHLEDAGHEVTSSWLKKSGDEAAEFALKPPHEHAEQDLLDILESEALVLFTDEQYARGGKHVEFGYAIGLGFLDMFVVGDHTENIFQTLLEVNCVPDVDSLLDRLAELE